MIIKSCHVLVLLVFYVDLVDEKKSLYDVGICDWKLIGDN